MEQDDHMWNSFGMSSEHIFMLSELSEYIFKLS